jgi:hypothetical protein
MIHICFEEDVYPFGLDDDDREYIAEAEREAARIAAIPDCPVCGESARWFKNGACPYINAEDHRIAVTP